MRLLVVEDERTLNQNISEHFRRKGYSTDSCFDGEEALDYLFAAQYDAVILDVMLPKLDGFSVVRKLREQGSSVPVLLLTARDSVDDKVFGLDCGANDYLVKPFEFRELEARIRAVMRSGTGALTNVYTVDDLIMDVKTHKVTKNGREIALSAREFAVLECLMRNAETVLSRERIESSVFGYDYMGGTNVVDVYIRYLRKKIEDDFGKKLIHTVRGVGYVIKKSEKKDD